LVYCYLFLFVSLAVIQAIYMEMIFCKESISVPFSSFLWILACPESGQSIYQFCVCHPIRTLIILVQDKNTSLKLPVGVSPLQLVNLHRNRRYFVIKLHKWFCLSYFLKTNITFYCIYQYFMSISSFFNIVSASRYSRNFNS
jgi:hypothetical protein